MSGVCCSLGPFSIGECGSESKINISTQSVTQSITETYKKTMQDAGITNIQITNQRIELIGYTSQAGCNNLEISQTAKLDINSQVNLSDTTAKQMLRNVAIAINNDIDQKMEQIKSSLADVNNTSLIMNVKNIIVRLSEDRNVIESVQRANNETIQVTGQDVKITFGSVPNLGAVLKEDGKCVISQDAQAKIVASATLSTLLDALNSDTEIQQIQAKLEQDQKLKSKGAIESVGDFVSSIFKNITLAYIIVGVAIIAGFVLFWYFAVKNPEGTKAVGEAASGVIKQAGESGSKLKRPI